jgi:outer membrane protein assembly factor BamD
MVRNAIRSTAAMLAVAVVLGGFSAREARAGLFRHKKYANPINKDTQQPDKVLFDKAINDIEHSRFEVARLLLQNLINTYDTSEYLAKAKLAIADAWFREGGTHGLAQAEAEYKDFILFYPAMEEAAEAQERVCDIHYKQLEKFDRDPMHALRAEQECKQVLLAYPNSLHAKEAEQKIRDIQEVLAEAEFSVGHSYQHKGSFAAAANRYQALVDQFPRFSGSDEALWQMADSYRRMGDRFENQQVTAYQRIVRDYPLSIHAEDAKAQLEVMKRPVPEVDPVAYARMKFELANRTKPGFIRNTLGMFGSRPDVSMAAKSGPPIMEGYRPTIPASVPVQAANPGGLGENKVTIENGGSTDPNAIDKGVDVLPKTGAGHTPEANPVAEPPKTTAAANTAKVPDPNEAAKQATMSPAEQKKAYQKALKEQQATIKQAQSDRKKKEAQNAAAVKEQKKKSKSQQDAPKPAAPKPDAGTQASPTPPAQQ